MVYPDDDTVVWEHESLDDTDDDDMPNLVDDDSDNDALVPIRAKWMLDGCQTLDQVIERLQVQIVAMQQLKRDGYDLSAPVEDDYGHLVRV